MHRNRKLESIHLHVLYSDLCLIVVLGGCMYSNTHYRHNTWLHVTCMHMCIAMDCLSHAIVYPGRLTSYMYMTCDMYCSQRFAELVPWFHHTASTLDWCIWLPHNVEQLAWLLLLHCRDRHHSFCCSQMHCSAHVPPWAHAPYPFSQIWVDRHCHAMIENISKQHNTTPHEKSGARRVAFL